MSSRETKEQAVKGFTELFPILTEEFLKEVRSRKFSEESVEWIKKANDNF